MFNFLPQESEITILAENTKEISDQLIQSLIIWQAIYIYLSLSIGMLLIDIHTAL